MRHTVCLSEGSVTVVLSLNFLNLFGDDRELVCGIIDLIQAYEKKHPLPPAPESTEAIAEGEMASMLVEKPPTQTSREGERE